MQKQIQREAEGRNQGSRVLEKMEKKGIEGLK